MDVLQLMAVCCYVVIVKADYELIENVGNWTEKQGRRRLATPPITASPGTINTLRIMGDVLDEGEKAWVGYVQDYQTFQYIGCVGEATIQDGQVDYNPTNAYDGPAYCNRACLDSVAFGLGLEVTQCVCFGKDDLETSSGCNKPCGNKNFACGGDHHFSMYKRVNLPLKNKNPYGKKCLMYHGGIYNWERCDKEFNVFCMTDTGNVSSLPHKGTWQESANRCFNNSIYPVVYTTSPSETNTNSFWTAHCKTWTIITLQDNMTFSSYVQYGFVTRGGNKYYLQFTTNKSITSNALCVKDSPVTTRTSTLVTTGAPDQPRNGEESGTTPIGVYAGIAVGILIVISLVVTGLILYKKRTKQETNNATNSKNGTLRAGNQSTVAGNNVKLGALGSNDYDYSSVPDQLPGPSAKDGAAGRDTDGANYYTLDDVKADYTYVDTEIELGRVASCSAGCQKAHSSQVYNSLDTGNPIGNQDPGVYDLIGNKSKLVHETGLYDKLAVVDDGDQTYDSTTKPTVGSTRHIPDELYSHTRGNSKADQTYDTTNQTNLAPNKYSTDDTYSHTNALCAEYSTTQHLNRRGETRAIHGNKT